MSVRADRFKWLKRDVEVSQCANCKHYSGNARCNAFQDSIPDAILTNEHDHRQPYPGDNGIQFEPIDDAQEGEKDA